MGNRAIIKFNFLNRPPELQLGIYLHWHGGRASIEAFLKVARELGVFQRYDDYGITLLSQIIKNYIGGLLSVQLDVISELPSAWDNGAYIIDKEFNIVYREFDKDLTGYKEQIDPEYTEAIYNKCMAINKPIFNDL